MQPTHFPKKINIAIADPNSIFREGLYAILEREPEINVIGQATDGHELINIVSRTPTDVVLTDINMPFLNGFEMTNIISKRYSSTSVIAFSTNNDEEAVIQMIQAGAMGYVIKNATNAEIVTAIKAVNLKGNYYCRSTSLKIQHVFNNSLKREMLPCKPANLSSKEISIIKLICQQYSSKEIACQLGVTTRAIESARERIQIKIGARNRVGIALYAIKHNLLDSLELVSCDY